MISRVTCDSKSVLLSLFSGVTYEWICSEVIKRFNHLKAGQFRLSYSLPDLESCKLECDMDVHLMLASLPLFKLSYVDILVNHDGVLVEYVACSAPSTSSKDTSASEVSYTRKKGASCSSSEDFESLIDPNQYLGDFGTAETKSYLSKEWEGYIDHVGQKFEGGVAEFRLKLVKYAVQMGFKFVYAKNDKDRIIAECFEKNSHGCKWRVYAVLCRANGFCYIRTMNNQHTCRGVVRETKGKMMSSRIVSSIVKDELRLKPSLRPIDIVQELKLNYGLDISYQNAWKGKEMAKLLVHGDEEASFQKLAWYVEAVKISNPGTHCVLQLDESSGRFQRFFISYSACIQGYRWCLPMVHVDGTFLKGKYLGHLLAANGRDGDKGTSFFF